MIRTIVMLTLLLGVLTAEARPVPAYEWVCASDIPCSPCDVPKLTTLDKVGLGNPEYRDCGLPKLVRARP